MAAVDARLGEIADLEIRPHAQVNRGYTRFENGDVLFAKITPCMENGKSAIAQNLVGGVGYGSTEFHVLRPGPKVLAEWVYFFIRRQSFRDEARDNFTGTAGQARVPVSFMKAVEIPVPSREEQARLVAILNEAMAQIRDARSALERVPGQMKRFRQSVLAQAFRGELTADWRAENGHRFREAAEWFDARIWAPLLPKQVVGPTVRKQQVAEPRILYSHDQPLTAEQVQTIPAEIRDWLPGDRLMEILLLERHCRWQSGNYAKRDLAPESPAPIPADLPVAWTSASLDQLIGAPLKNGLSIPGSECPPGLAALKLSAIRSGSVDYSDVRYLPVSAEECEDILLKAGDLLIARGNGTLSLVGRAGVAGEPLIPTIFPDTLIRARALPAIREYLALAWHSDIVRIQLETKAKTTAGIWKVSQGDLKPTAIPLPPLAEQIAIVSCIEALFTEAAEAESTAFAALADLHRLEQSVLESAFRGQL